MERILEPEYMDTPEEATGYEAMDHTEANDSVVSAFLAAGGADAARILDIGTGPGDVPILIAQRTESARITALDAAREMLKLAERKISDAGLSERIRLEVGDAKALPFADGEFDGVISNTILHHIPDPIPYLREAGRVLAEDGGTLLIRDLCRPESRERAQALVEQHAAGANAMQQKLFFDSLLAALTLDEARDACRAAGIAAASVEMTSDRHFTIVLRR